MAAASQVAADVRTQGANVGSSGAAHLKSYPGQLGRTPSEVIDKNLPGWLLDRSAAPGQSVKRYPLVFEGRVRWRRLVISAFVALQDPAQVFLGHPCPVA